MYVLQHKKNKQFNIQQFLMRFAHISKFNIQNSKLLLLRSSSALISESSMSTTTGLMLYQPLTS